MLTKISMLENRKVCTEKAMFISDECVSYVVPRLSFNWSTVDEPKLPVALAKRPVALPAPFSYPTHAALSKP
jgi:hypothetical protein